MTSCPGSDGFSGEIWFPFCWDGSEDFDPSDPYAHVVFGDGDSPQGGKCSGNHTKALPQLFMEFHHDISAFASKPQAAVPWVLAQGDGTGYGMHADFVSSFGQTCWATFHSLTHRSTVGQMAKAVSKMQLHSIPPTPPG